MLGKNSKKGMTLIEVIVAMAIFGIVAVSFLSMFGNGYATVFRAGHRTDANLQLRTIIDGLHRQMAIDKPSDTIPIKAHMDPKGNYKASIADIAVKGTGNVNYSVVDKKNDGTDENIDGTLGFSVTVLVFYSNGTEYIKATTFIVKGGF